MTYIVTNVKNPIEYYTREKLIEICEKSIVNEKEWWNRDTPHSQKKVGVAWAYLKAGCEFKVSAIASYEGDGCVTDDKTIWLEIKHKTFNSMEGDGEPDWETFYLPTEKRLKAREGSDWY